MKKILSILIVFSMIISANTVVFASDVSEMGLVGSEDTIISFDSGAYDILMGISDIEKQALLTELWCTPVYTEITYESGMTSSRMKAYEGKGTAEGLNKYLTMTNEEIKNAISELVSNTIDELSTNPDIYATQNLVQLAEKYNVECSNILISTPIVSIENNLNNEVRGPAALAASVKSYSKTFTATSKNVNGVIIAKMVCNVNWTGDGTIVHSLNPKTTVTMDKFFYQDGGLRRTKQFIKKEGTVQYGYVQKANALIGLITPGFNVAGYLVVDVKVSAAGAISKQYVNYISPLAYDLYKWVNP